MDRELFSFATFFLPLLLHLFNTILTHYTSYKYAIQCNTLYRLFSASRVAREEVIIYIYIRYCQLKSSIMSCRLYTIAYIYKVVIVFCYTVKYVNNLLCIIHNCGLHFIQYTIAQKLYFRRPLKVGIQRRIINYSTLKNIPQSGNFLNS